MKNSIVDRTLFHGTAWMLLLLIPITFFGFYPSYFAKLNAPTPTVIHLHSAFMLLWLVTAIAQPLLIKFNKLNHHRLVGKISYGVMPLVILSGYFILRYSYHRALGGDAVGPPGFYPTDLSPEIKAAEFVVIGTVYWIWLIVYYVLGVSFRKNMVAHTTFMLAASLTILGPAGDRLIGHICDAFGWPFNAIAANFVFGFVLFVFTALTLLHAKRKQILWPGLLALIIQGIGIFLFFKMPYHTTWNKLAYWLFN
ncbi:MAG TPA: hypothetical protein PLV21_03315 [Cyclobacteriaceae bacterium]|nr:hypothetical protein [Cyclobacteriaceae bacterium]HRJ80887.1 hypothetical protein [Cyclobacteriaceae bacterium]